MKNLELEHVQFFFVQQNTADHPVIPIMAASSGAAGFCDWMALGIRKRVGTPIQNN